MMLTKFEKKSVKMAKNNTFEKTKATPFVVPMKKVCGVPDMPSHARIVFMICLNNSLLKLFPRTDLLLKIFVLRKNFLIELVC